MKTEFYYNYYNDTLYKAEQEFSYIFDVNKLDFVKIKSIPDSEHYNYIKGAEGFYKFLKSKIEFYSNIVLAFTAKYKNLKISLESLKNNNFIFVDNFSTINADNFIFVFDVYHNNFGGYFNKSNTLILTRRTGFRKFKQQTVVDKAIDYLPTKIDFNNSELKYYNSILSNLKKYLDNFNENYAEFVV